MTSLTRLLAVLVLAGRASNVSAIPITGADIMTVDGTEWAQVDLFTNLSWNDINAVCPGGVCGVGTLNGFDMDGWIWASWDGVNALLNHYLIAAGVSGNDLLGPGADPIFGDSLQETGSVWAADFFGSGWRPTVSSAPNFQYTLGLTRQLILGVEISTAAMHWSPNGSLLDSAETVLLFTDDRDSADSSRGAWFFQAEVPPSGVPAPGTLGLFGLALAGIGWIRRKKA